MSSILTQFELIIFRHRLAVIIAFLLTTIFLAFSATNIKLDASFNIFNSEAETVRITENGIDKNKPIAKQLCNIMFEQNINSVIIEGGSKTISTFINENLWDEARVFRCTSTFNNGIKAPILKHQNLINKTQISNDTLLVFKKINR